MFRCNLTNGRGKTNLFDVELLLIVNATAEFSLFPCANNYSRELSATFLFFSSPSPLLVHVLLLHLSSMFLSAHEKFSSPSKSTQSTIFCFALFLTIIPRKINPSQRSFSQNCVRVRFRYKIKRS